MYICKPYIIYCGFENKHILILHYTLVSLYNTTTGNTIIGIYRIWVGARLFYSEYGSTLYRKKTKNDVIWCILKCYFFSLI